jgi:hypothetical protein
MSFHDEAIDLLDELDGLLDDIEDIDAAADFYESVKEKADSMRMWIEDREYATIGQVTALENMIAGCRRWLRDGE